MRYYRERVEEIKQTPWSWLEHNHEEEESRAVKEFLKGTPTTPLKIDYRQELLSSGQLSKHLDFFLHFHGWFESDDSVFLAMDYPAAQLEEQTVEVRKHVLGAEHPYTLVSMCNLATSYHLQGLFQRAVLMRERIVEGRTRVLGAEHVDTLRSTKDLAYYHLKLSKRYSLTQR